MYVCMYIYIYTYVGGFPEGCTENAEVALRGEKPFKDRPAVYSLI